MITSYHRLSHGCAVTSSYRFKERFYFPNGSHSVVPQRWNPGGCRLQSKLHSGRSTIGHTFLGGRYHNIKYLSLTPRLPYPSKQLEWTQSIDLRTRTTLIYRCSATYSTSRMVLQLGVMIFSSVPYSDNIFRHICPAAVGDVALHRHRSRI